MVKMFVDTRLTPESAEKQGYQWIVDIVPAILRGELREIEDYERKQHWRLGKPKKENLIAGLYVPIKNMNIDDFPVDEALEKSNAKEKGYVFELNISPSATPSDVLQDIVKLIETEGFTFGCPERPLMDDDRGLYKPLDLKTKK